MSVFCKVKYGKDNKKTSIAKTMNFWKNKEKVKKKH